MRREEVQGTNNGVNGTSGMTKNQDGDLKVAATKAKRPGKDPCQVGQAEACATKTQGGQWGTVPNCVAKREARAVAIWAGVRLYAA